MQTTASLWTTAAHTLLRLRPPPYTVATSAVTVWPAALTGEMLSKPPTHRKPAPPPPVLTPRPLCTAWRRTAPSQPQARPSPLPTLRCTAERGAADTEPVRDLCSLLHSAKVWECVVWFEHFKFPFFLSGWVLFNLTMKKDMLTYFLASAYVWGHRNPMHEVMRLIVL